MMMLLLFNKIHKAQLLNYENFLISADELLKNTSKINYLIFKLINLFIYIILYESKNTRNL